jgi:hypothetical protein
MNATGFLRYSTLKGKAKDMMVTKRGRHSHQPPLSLPLVVISCVSESSTGKHLQKLILEQSPLSKQSLEVINRLTAQRSTASVYHALLSEPNCQTQNPGGYQPDDFPCSATLLRAEAGVQTYPCYLHYLVVESTTRNITLRPIFCMK